MTRSQTSKENEKNESCNKSLETDCEDNIDYTSEDAGKEDGHKGTLDLSTSTRSSTRTTSQTLQASHLPISSHELPSLPKTNMN